MDMDFAVEKTDMHIEHNNVALEPPQLLNMAA